MSPRIGRGPGRRSAGAAAGGGVLGALAAARAFGLGAAALGLAAFGFGAGAAFFFFGSGFLLAIDVTYGSREGEGSQGQPEESGDLARVLVRAGLERLGKRGRFP